MTIVFPLSDPAVTITTRGFLLVDGEPCTPSGIVYGKPAMERADAENRRGAMSHAFPAADLAQLPSSFQVVPAMPADWRRPASIFPGR